MDEKSVQVEMGQAHAASKGNIISASFFDCNLVLLKNLDKGEVLLLHCWFDEEPSTRFWSRPYCNVNGTPLIGISDAQQKTLKDFLSKDGEKVGIRLYNPSYHRDSEPMSARDKIAGEKIDEFLRTKNVLMKRHTIPYFEGRSEDSVLDEAYDVSYDVDTDRLKVFVTLDAHLDGLGFELPKSPILDVQPFGSPESFKHLNHLSR